MATPAPEGNRVEVADITIDNPNLELVDYLRRVPGIQIGHTEGNTTVMVRGASTITGENSPLFIIDVDGSPVGNRLFQL